MGEQITTEAQEGGLLRNAFETEPLQLRSSAAYPLLIDSDQRAASEYFAVLRGKLLQARSKSNIHSFVITSPQREDGKSLTSINLAISLAQLRKERVLLVDGDLRLTGITQFLKLNHSVGVADFLRGEQRFDACVRGTNLSHLFVAPSGNVGERDLPSILEGTRWKEFIELAAAEFDLVIVDSVPVSAPIADFDLLLNGCDAMLLVVQVRKTKREALEDTAQRVNGKLLGVIVNNFEPSSDSYYRSYYGGKKAR